MAELTIRVPPDDETVLVVHLRDEVDIETADAVSDAVDLAIEAGRRSLVFDLSEVTFMDSQGIKALIVARAKLATVEGSVCLRRPSRAVRRVLDLTAVDGLFETVD